MNCPTRSGFDLIDNKSCGRVANDRYEVRIADENDFELPPGTPGAALVRAKEPWIITAGYWNHPEWTEKAFRNLWFHTGDLGVLHPDGYVEIKDRSKDIIISGGENISSLEIEDVLYKHPEVMEAAVVANPGDGPGGRASTPKVAVAVASPFPLITSASL